LARETALGIDEVLHLEPVEQLGFASELKFDQVHF